MDDNRLKEIESNVLAGKTSWIYGLNKLELQTISEHFGLSITEETTADEVRKLLSDFTKKIYSENKEKEESLNVLGTTDVSIKYKEIETTLPLVVVDEQGQNLLERNWFEALGIEVTGINNITEPEQHVTKNLVLEKFPSLTQPTLTRHNGPLINIQLKENARPHFIKARRIPYGLQEAARDALNSMVQQGMLKPVDQSIWATPVIFVRKLNGKIRVVGDYKTTVNPKIMNSEYPLPTIEEALSTLNGGEFFSQVDLKDAYKQLQVDEETSKILTINTPMCLFNVLRLLDGIAAAPRIFQKYMVTIMSGIPGIKIYLDNVKIQCKIIEEHDQRLLVVLHRLQQANLRLNVEKSIFRVKSMEFLGQKISKEGIETLNDKVEDIKKIPSPKNKRELQVFVGSEVLIHFDDKLPIVLSADASPHGTRAVLAHELPDQRQKAIAFSSKTLNKTQRHYAQLDREVLALVQAVKHFHQYIAGRSFKLITDHKPLLGIFDNKKKNPDMISPKLNRYEMIPSAYDYDLIYLPAKKHGNADILSRFPMAEEAVEDEKVGAVLMLERITRNAITPEELTEETRNDNKLRKIKKKLQTKWPEKIEPDFRVFWQKREELSIINECLTWGARVIVPKKLQPEIINYLHANHPGIVATKAYARSYVWWPGINNDIELKIKNCGKCQEVQNNPPRAPVKT
ncbi:uncharacterized protein K02A2.6-like [Neodiprion fabricii]|uniref:uncharacterized protein K02A2.6-like n=1 Tax=Neodiprion fabricii TaxID=2872261 RepID=UPI001ED95327|nr:uncharacterized protein K02A2.6-like [Neodiprion fabricii]